MFNIYSEFSLQEYNENANDTGFCINLVVNSVKDENSIGFDVFMSLDAFRTDLQFSRVKAFMRLFIEKNMLSYIPS